jgi:UDP-N-acetylmuramate: L-alanyl-gamma-D-glutamyl-meso-diaminopimelate ligase
VLEPRSNTMRMGVHKQELADALAGADQSFLFQRDDLGWSLADTLSALGPRARVLDDLDGLVRAVSDCARPGDQVVVMSNGDFGGIHERLLAALAA